MLHDLIQLPQALACGYKKFNLNKALAKYIKKKMPFVKADIHFVWSTKNRLQTLNTPELREKIWQHIRANAIRKDIFIDLVPG